MSIASLQDIHHEFGKVELLRGITLDLYAGERVALVGPNGSGKTTILRILARQLLPTSGQVVWGRNVRVGYLPQQPKMETDDTVRAVASRPFREVVKMEARLRELSVAMAEASGEELGRLMKQYSHLEAGHLTAGGFSWEHRVEEVLAGVGFAPEERDKPCRVLSGGQQCRLALAGVLLGGADLLLLDEPTNHLDLEGVQWLEKYLTKLSASVVLISHDRYLLDRVAMKVHELSGGRTELYPGNYTRYVQEREIRRLHRLRQYEKDQAYIAKEQDFIARFHASGSRSREARGRATRLERRLKAGEFMTDTVRDDRTLSLRIAAASRGSDQALVLDGICKAFGDAPIVEDLSLKLRGGQKLAILGPNGVGKTTVLRMALGEERPDAGTAVIGKGMTVGYYDQKQLGLDDSLTVLEQMAAFAGTADENVLRGWLARFLFTGQEVFKSVAALSGGERSRLLLARLLFSRPNFLILDEPTNHLDIASREMLEEALAEYDGTVLLVSHDRYFVDRVCNRLLLLWPRRWEVVEGNYTFWREREERKAAEAAEAAARAEAAKRPAQSAPARQKAATERVGGLNSYQMSRLTLEEVEQQIHGHERALVEIEQSFSDPAVFSDASRLAQAQADYDARREQIDALMEVWQVKMEQEG
ncbi:MAG: ABC-F family ATP-binding cassette domain-containing protein [Planctomycetes bacterium]|nr:ABC-F family ATP-binding cassette domain-containing protein [Planctomycetota bacterium]